MFKRGFFQFLIGLFYLLFLQSFIYAQTPTPTIEPTPEETPTNTINNPEPIEKKTENIIHIGDLIDVDVVGSAEYDWRGNLTPEGFLNGISFVEEPIYAQCRSEEEVAAEV